MSKYILITADFECQQLSDDYFDTKEEFLEYSGLSKENCKELLDSGCLDDWSRHYILLETQ